MHVNDMRGRGKELGACKRHEGKGRGGAYRCVVRYKWAQRLNTQVILMNAYNNNI